MKKTQSPALILLAFLSDPSFALETWGRMDIDEAWLVRAYSEDTNEADFPDFAKQGNLGYRFGNNKPTISVAFNPERECTAVFSIHYLRPTKELSHEDIVSHDLVFQFDEGARAPISNAKFKKTGYMFSGWFPASSELISSLKRRAFLTVDIYASKSGYYINEKLRYSLAGSTKAINSALAACKNVPALIKK